MADGQKHPLAVTFLEADMDINQIDRTLELMSKAEEAIRTDKPMTYEQFKEKICEIIPSQKNNDDFPKAILRTLNKKFESSPLFRYYKTTVPDL